MNAPAFSATRAALSPQLARAQRYVADHPEQVALGSLRSVAARLGVAPATLSRLARALGYGSYAALRSQCAATLADRAGYGHRVRRLQARAGAHDSLAEVNAAQVAAVQSAGARNPRRRLRDFCRAIRRARRVGFLGLRASHAAASYFAYVYGLLRDNGALLGLSPGALQDEIDRLSAQDALVAVSVAPYTRATLECAQRARTRGVTVLVLSDSAASPLARSAACSLAADTESPSFFSTMVGVIACVEAALVQLALEEGERAVRRLAAMDERLRRAGAYADTAWRRNLGAGQRAA